MPQYPDDYRATQGVNTQYTQYTQSTQPSFSRNASHPASFGSQPPGPYYGSAPLSTAGTVDEPRRNPFSKEAIEEHRARQAEQAEQAEQARQAQQAQQYRQEQAYGSQAQGPSHFPSGPPSTAQSGQYPYTNPFLYGPPGHFQQQPPPPFYYLSQAPYGPQSGYSAPSTAPVASQSLQSVFDQHSAPPSQRPVTTPFTAAGAPAADGESSQRESQLALQRAFQQPYGQEQGPPQDPPQHWR